MGGQQGKEQKDLKSAVKTKATINKPPDIRTGHSGNIFTEHNGKLVAGCSSLHCVVASNVTFYSRIL